VPEHFNTVEAGSEYIEAGSEYMDIYYTTFTYTFSLTFVYFITLYFLKKLDSYTDQREVQSNVALTLTLGNRQVKDEQ
jgi:hypothetical protein